MGPDVPHPVTYIPCTHSWSLASRWKKNKLLLMMSGCIICNYLVVLGFLRALHMLDNNIPESAGTYDENSSALCLAYYLCPIGWVTTFVMDIIAAFIFDQTLAFV